MFVVVAMNYIGFMSVQRVPVVENIFYQCTIVIAVLERFPYECFLIDLFQ